MKFYPSDWRADAMLRLCSIGARGLWAEMMCLMHEATPYGSLLVNGRRIDKKQLSGLAAVSERECTALLMELEGNGVFSRDPDGTIYSRRMRRDAERAAIDKANGKKGGAPDLIGGRPQAERDRRFSRKDNPTKVEAVWVSSQGKCAACAREMQRDYPNEPDAFTVDHVIAIAQGGDNSLENLQGLCRSCNRKKGITPPDHKMSNGVKAQKPEATTKKEDRIVDAGASRFTEGSKALASALWKALGIESPIACPPELAGADWRAIGWERAGWTVDLIETEARRVGPDKPLSYYEKVFATAFAKRQAPLPVVEVREAEKLTVNHGTSERKSGSLIAAIDRQLAALEAEAGAHSALPENPVLRISG